MKINRLITLGCSLTHHIGWAQHLSNRLNLPLINLSESSGSNQLQQWRFQELVFKDNITDKDIVIWQVTGSERKFFRKKLYSVTAEQKEKYASGSPVDATLLYSKNIFDDCYRLDHLSHSRCKIKNWHEEHEQHLENLLFYIISSKKMTPNTFVIYGWEKCIPFDYKLIFEEQLSKHNITIFKQPIVEWCHTNKLKFHSDNMHPLMSAYEKYVDNYLLSTLQEFIE